MFFESVEDWINAGKPLGSLICGNCMEGMAAMGENKFDLAIVDPPYGIGKDGQIKTTGGHGGRKEHIKKEWDNKIPSVNYFKQLFHVSEHQIIWGANFFTRYLPKSMGWIFWDKGQRINQSDGELAFSSFNCALRVAEYNRVELLLEGTIHPTQKPVALYRWLLHNYAKPVWTILDTHAGSCSSLIACESMGFEFVGFELDRDYWEAACKRIEQWRKSRTLDMFEEPKQKLGEQVSLL